MTVHGAIKRAEALLDGAGLDSPVWQARLLAAHVLGRQPAQLLNTQAISFSPGNEETFFSLVKRRLSGEPLQHITGSWDFYGRTFSVTPAALIPRPETEELIDLVRKIYPGGPWLILDAGTGSGVIGITLALEFPEAAIIAGDISPEAIQLARENAKLLGAANYHPVICDLTDPFRGAFDGLVANLPYIPTEDIESLAREVRDHDPIQALDGGQNGLSLILALIEQASGLLKPGGFIALETGFDQEKAVVESFPRGLWSSISAHRDLSGNHRFVTAVRSDRAID